MHLIPRQDKSNVLKTGRKMVLDLAWITLPAGAHTFLYGSDIDFILIKTDTSVKFRRSTLNDKAARLGGIVWDKRNGEQYHVFKIDPAQKLIIIGSPTVRFIRCSHEQEVSVYDDVSNKTPLWKREKRGSPWEAEDVYKQRDEEVDETFPPEHLAEAGRRFRAWMANRENSLFVYLMVPKYPSDREFEALREGGIILVPDVSLVL